MTITAKQLLLGKIDQVKRYLLQLKHNGQDVVLFNRPVVQVEKQESVFVEQKKVIPVKPFKSKQTISEPKNEFEQIAYDANHCTQCGIASQRKQTIFGEGDPEAKLVFVGEAPGSEEDITGQPIAGAAGDLLTKIIESIGLKREDVYICNVLKCRPPGNRNPAPEEMANCKLFLERQLAFLKPEVICALGTFAAQTLLESKEPIGKLRGKQYELGGVKIVPTFHPAALLYNPNNKRFVWEDMKMIARLLKLPLNSA